MDANTVTAAATAITAVFVLLVPLYVEYSRRLHEAKQTHFKDIKRFVLEDLNDILTNHYSDVLEHNAGALGIRSERVSPEGISIAEQPHRWKPVLHVLPPASSLPASLGDALAIQEREKTFSHLYGDIGQYHFAELTRQWNQFTQRFQHMSHTCLIKTQHISTQLEAQLKFPPYDEYSQAEKWIDYLRLSLLVYERLWGIHSGALGMYQEGDHWILNVFGQRCGRGTQEELESFRITIDHVLSDEASGFTQLADEVKLLKIEALELKQMIEKTLLQQKLPGNCPYTRVTYF